MLTWAAALAAMAAAAFFGLRGQMLKPEISDFPDSPRCVRWACFIASLACGLYVVSVTINHYQATRTEAAMLSALALYAFLLWVNLYRQNLASREVER